VTLLRGSVLDRETGKPVGTDFEVRSIDGKLLQQGRSDAQRGTFEVVLQPGQRYIFTFRGYNILRQSDTLELPPSKEYSEVSHVFRVRLLRPGMLLLQLRAFEPGQTTLLPSARPALDELKQLLNRNRSLRITVNVSIIDTRLMDEPASSPKQKSRKQRKGSAPAPAPSPLLERAQAFAHARIEAVRAYLLPGVRDAEERIRFVPDIPPLPIARPIVEAPTVTVFVDQVRDLLE
jgi:hypothetical protein